mmetsp:Transcript_5258/g.9414  ORF Transcript_5258/g.9414 Transcript_5258/m.9414 type:complete len:99 (+) Transcript_5258:1651-1947(+)
MQYFNGTSVHPKAASLAGGLTCPIVQRQDFTVFAKQGILALKPLRTGARFHEPVGKRAVRDQRIAHEETACLTRSCFATSVALQPDFASRAKELRSSN